MACSEPSSQGGTKGHSKVPAEDLEEFNSHIIGRITVEAGYYGDKFNMDDMPADLKF